MKLTYSQKRKMRRSAMYGSEPKLCHACKTEGHSLETFDSIKSHPVANLACDCSANCHLEACVIATSGKQSS